MKKASLLALSLLVAGGLFFPFKAHAAAPARPDNVMKVLESNKDLSKFTDVVKSAGMASELESKDERLTVFAPNNAAMDKLDSGVLKRAKDEKDGLKTFVKYHLIKGSVVFSGNIKGRRASPSTAAGEMMGFDGTGKELKVNNGVITTPDLSAMNGVVQVVSAVLVPDSLRDPKIKEEERAKAEKVMKDEMETRQKEMEARQKEMEAKMAKEAPKAPAKAEEAAKAPEAPKAPEVASPEAPTAPAAPAPSEKKEEKTGWRKWFN
ncbi:MAG: fasciclin domain-containing protein [Alphaproteobacteria bacterium]|nr:fasciclin domain-containing protein [Alphaproteobacteria bacterium]